MRSLLCTLALVTAAVAAPPPPAVTVAGNHLEYRGKALELRGVAVGDPFSAREGRPLSDYERIARDWNANAVRISLHPTEWIHRPHVQVLDRLEQEVRAAVAAGLFVVLDWHTIGWPDGYFEKHPEWDSPDDLYDSRIALAQSFWEAAAQRFGADRRILFELWNEPVFHVKEGEDSGGSRWTELKPVFERLIGAIRPHAANVVLATGARWAYDLHGIRAAPLADPQAAYAWHIYAGHDDNDPARWTAALDDVDRTHPVLVTEWGFQPGSHEHFGGTAAEFGTPFATRFLQARNLSWTAWCWHPEWGPPMLGKDWKTPNVFGAFVRSLLRDAKPTRP